ncbi:MAG: hypothetical protein NTZ77_02055 [Caldiserica bacterium]|nr:hypothetical protein [Caldisericota bacterium]
MAVSGQPEGLRRQRVPAGAPRHQVVRPPATADSRDAYGRPRLHLAIGWPAIIRPDTDFVTWLRKKPSISIPTVLIRLDDVRLTSRSGCLLRSDIMQDAILRNLQVISIPSVTNYKVTAIEELRLEQVWEARRVRDL